MFDDQHTIAAIHQILQNLQQQAYIMKMETGRGFIEQIQRAPVSRRDSSFANLTRCASPPESVGEGCPSLM